MLDTIIIIALVSIIILQVLERYLVLELGHKKEDKLLDEISKANKALVAKSAQEYVMMRAIDKTMQQTPEVKDPQHVDSSELDDETYDKLIAQQNS